jgi:hypothetical protein
MLKLSRGFCVLDYAQSWGLKHGIRRTNPYNAGLLQNIRGALCL